MPIEKAKAASNSKSTSKSATKSLSVSESKSTKSAKPASTSNSDKNPKIKGENISKNEGNDKVKKSNIKISNKPYTNSKARLLLIDGHSLAFRAYYALPVENFITNQGQPTNILYGFSNMLMALIQSEKPTHIAVAFDRSKKTFRSELFPEYKSHRSATPPEFLAQK